MSDDVRYQPRFGVDIRVKPDTHEEPVKRHCDRPNCEAEGRYRAPKGPDVLNQYYWFCLDHVREYNLSWDYFRGMKPEEIDAYQREALTGHRPTWKLGDRNAGTIKSDRLHAIFGINEPYRILEDGPGRPAPERTRKPLRSPLQVKALETLDLEPSASWDDIKLRYKELVKKFHPDANGGDRSAEDRLKAVIKAYGQLRSSGIS